VAVNVRRSRPPSLAARQANASLKDRLRDWVSEWPREAWGAIGVTALFLLLGIWWVERDHSVPISDAGFHLQVTIEVFKDLQAGEWGKAVEPHLQYPPLVYMLGALGAFIGGLSIPSIVIMENLFYVPLLALGCYQIGRLAFGPRAGLLAVVFALGSPLVARLFHLTMLDAPQAAMAAASVWLILATRYFSRLWVSAAAGLVVALGMLTKESVLLFVIGVLAVTLLRGGWRNWRGIAVFGAVVLVVAGPWYINDFSQVQQISTGVAEAGTAPNSSIAPPRLSSENLEWYLWSFLDLQLYLPLFLLGVVGGVWTLVGFIRRHWVSPFAPELFVGGVVAWLALTETFVHDNRYGMSMLVYFAVFGSFWILRLPRPGRIAATTALVAVALANTLSSNANVGGSVEASLPHALARAKAEPNFAMVYSDEGYLVPTGPERASNMLGVLQQMKRAGIEGVLMLPSTAPNEAAFLEGLSPLTLIAGMKLGESAAPPTNLPTSIAVFDRELLKANSVPPCVKLPDGTGVWIRLGNPYAKGAQDYCPARNPQFYS
jgi:hypothetical protein